MAITFVSVPLAPWDIVSTGIHLLTLTEFKEIFAFNPHRRNQFNGLITALKDLKYAGCSTVFIDGSYVTKKPLPGDYDACWDTNNIDMSKLDPAFRDFSNGRASQKEKYEGEFFPALANADATGTKYLDFFQVEKHSGNKKGIICLDLSSDEIDQFGDAQ
jgi:hypothetical protein